jgi:ArsR family transcriptional regulator
MDQKTLERLHARTAILKAMAHPARLHILECLGEGERCVCDLQREVGSDISTVSKHLAVLCSAGLVRDRRQGTQVFYSLLTPCVLDIFACVEQAACAGARRTIRALS